MFIYDKYICCRIGYVDSETCICLRYSVNKFKSCYFDIDCGDSNVGNGIRVDVWVVRVVHEIEERVLV
jgi:hypothetical protein